MTLYLVKTMFEPILLRRVDLLDQALSRSGWYPTPAVVNYMDGHDDFVDNITEDERVGLMDSYDRPLDPDLAHELKSHPPRGPYRRASP